jgi:hypothetical protein
MAQLPKYEPLGRQQAAPSGVMNIQAPNLIAPIAQAAGAAVDAWGKEAKRISDLRVEELNNRADEQRALIEAQMAGTKGEFALKGVNGAEPFEDQRKQWLAFREEALKGLQDDYQKEQASLLLDKHTSALVKFGLKHQLREQDEWEKQVHSNTADRAAVNITARPDDVTNVEENMSKIRASVLATNPGIKESDLDMTILRAQSAPALAAFSAAVAKGQTVGDTFDHLYSYMTPSDQAKAKDLVSKGDRVNESAKVADYLYHPGMTNTEAVEAAGQFSPNDAHLADAVKDRLHVRIAAEKADQKKYDDDRDGEIILDMINGRNGGVGGARRRVESDIRMSSAQKASTRLKIDNWLKAQKESDGSNEQHVADYLALATSPSFHTMSREEVLLAASKLGTRYGPALVSQWQQAAAEGGKLSVPPEIRRVVAVSAGLDEKNPDHKRLIDEAVAASSDEFRTTNKGKGKFAERPTNKQWLDDLGPRLQQLKVDTRLFGFGSVIKPVGDMTPQEKTKAVEFMDLGDRKIIKKDLERRNEAVTPDSMIREYYTLQRIKVADPELYKKLRAAADPGSTETPVTAPQPRVD